MDWIALVTALVFALASGILFYFISREPTDNILLGYKIAAGVTIGLTIVSLIWAVSSSMPATPGVTASPETLRTPVELSANSSVPLSQTLVGIQT